MKRKLSVDEWLKKYWIQLIPYIMFILITAVTMILNSNTISARWIGNKADTAFTLALVAIGQTVILLTGGFDLSVGGIICVVNCLAASHMQDNVGSMLLWAAVCILIGAGIGMFNGYAIEKTKLQPFIVTLATQSVCMGIALMILKIDGGDVPSGYCDALLYRFGGVLPLSLVLLAFLIAGWMAFKKTAIGTAIYAIGSNEKAAHLNGISVLRTRVIAYAISGVFAALAGLFRTAYVASGSPTAGGDFVMTSISAAVIGGTSLSGGSGGIVGTIIGAFILRGINDLLVFMKVSSYWTSLVQGLLLIFAVALSAYGTLRKKRGGAS